MKQNTYSPEKGKAKENVIYLSFPLSLFLVTAFIRAYFSISLSLVCILLHITLQI